MYCTCDNRTNYYRVSDEHTTAYICTDCKKEIEDITEGNSEYCTCDNQKVETATDSEQHGGDIREVITGYYCSNCNKEIDPDDMPTKEEMDFELYSNE